MRVRKAALVVPFVFTVATAAQAQTSSPPTTQVTIGAKVWHAGWLSYVPASYVGVAPNGSPAIGDSVNAVEGDRRTSVMPQIAIRHGKYFASLSHGRFKSDFSVQTSPLIVNGQNIITARTDHFKRRETDLNLAYFLTPELGIAVGYKDATEERDTTLSIAPRTPLVQTKVRGFLIGAVGSFAVADKLRLYLQAGYGPARLKLYFADPAFSDSKADGHYTVGEIGLSYPLFTNPSGYGGATAALGYRTQTVKTDSYADTFQNSRELRDVRDGLVLSLNYTF